MRRLTLALIILLSIFLRFYQLVDAPPSLNWDEASVLWNAYSMVKTGSDEYGNSIPVSVRSFEDFKPPLLTYAVTGSVLLFGKNEFAVRFPSALAGTLVVLVIFFLLYETTKNRRLSLLTAFLVTFMPWHLTFSRIAFEASLALFLFTTAVLFLARFLSGKREVNLLVSLAMFVLACYTHHSVRLAFPLFFGGMVLFKRSFFWERKKIFFIGVILTSVLLFPLLYSNWRYQSISARFGQTSIFYSPGLKDVAKMYVDKQNEYLADDNLNSDFISKIAHNKIFTYGRLFAVNYLNHFNFDFLFLTGDVNSRHSTVGVGELYFWQLPLILAGSYYLLKKKPRWILIFVWWLLVAPVASSLTTETPHASRSFLLIVPFAVISAFGLIQIKKRIILILLSLFILINMAFYLHQYHFHMPLEKAGAWQYGYKQLVEKVNLIKDEHKLILVTKYYDQPYVYFLLYGNYSASFKNDGTFSEGFDEFRFVNFGTISQRDLDKIDGESLFVLAPSEFKDRMKIIDQIYDTAGKPVFIIARKL